LLPLRHILAFSIRLACCTDGAGRHAANVGDAHNALLATYRKTPRFIVTTLGMPGWRSGRGA